MRCAKCNKRYHTISSILCSVCRSECFQDYCLEGVTNRKEFERDWVNRIDNDIFISEDGIIHIAKDYS